MELWLGKLSVHTYIQLFFACEEGARVKQRS